MRARRYTVLIADRSSGVVRRVGVSLRPAIAMVLGILSVPILMGLGAKWSAHAEIDQLRSANSVISRYGSTSKGMRFSSPAFSSARMKSRKSS